jgi:hypothetical protein
VVIPTRVVLEPIVELGYATVANEAAGLFDVVDFFGRSSLWSITLALRIRSPGPRHRMGRYGISQPEQHQH